VIATKEAPQPGARLISRVIDRSIEFAGALNTAQSVLLASVVYAGWGIGLPLLLNSSRAVLIILNTEGAVLAAAIIFARAVPFIEGRLRRQRLQLTTSLRQLSAREFEDLVAALLDGEGWTVTKTAGHGIPDGNVDLDLRRGDQRRLVQCKRWSSWDLGVDEVRKLGGALLREGLAGSDGILMTSSGFYPAAIAEAEKLGIELIAGDDLVRRLEAVGATGLLGRATRGGWRCPDCASPMLLGKSSYGWWLRCPDYPSACKGKHHLGADDRLVVEELLTGR
jgi:restriction system protein